MYIKLNFRKQPEGGLTLIELLIFIVIVGIAATAILGVFGSLTRNSASMLPDKQAQAIAASMLQEVLAQPFTFCDPDDGNALIAMNSAGCANPLLREDNLAPEVFGTIEMRSGANPFDNVNDYNSLTQFTVSIRNEPPATDGALTGLPNYRYQVTVAIITALPNVTVTPGDALLVTVVVTGPNGVAARLQGVRIRYAPNKI